MAGSTNTSPATWKAASTQLSNWALYSICGLAVSYRSCGSWELNRHQTQPSRQHLQPQLSAFNPMSPGTKGQKKQCVTPKMLWSPGTSELWASAGHNCLYSGAQKPSCPAAQGVTQDKHLAITVILGICPNLFTWANGLQLLGFPVTAEDLLHTRVWSLRMEEGP